MFSLWLGGVSCLAGHLTILMATELSGVASHASCHHTKKTSKIDNAIGSHDPWACVETNCCPLTGQIAFNKKQASKDFAFTPEPVFASIHAKLAGDEIQSSEQTTLPDGTGTYLRNCTILI